MSYVQLRNVQSKLYRRPLHRDTSSAAQGLITFNNFLFRHEDLNAETSLRGRTLAKTFEAL